MALSGFSNSLTRAVQGAQSMLGYPAEHEKSMKKSIRIKKLFVHPIKSCRGTSVPEAHFDDGGLRYDRSWLIIDANTRRFQTARDLAKMVTITPSMDLTNNVLSIKIPMHEKGEGEVIVKTPLDPSQEELSKMELVEDILIWVHKVDGYAVSKEADDCLSRFFGKPVRLVRKGPSVRPSGPDDPRGASSAMHFQDFYPFLVASTASIQHVRDTMLASLYPGMGGKNNDSGVEVNSYKVSDRVSREYWTPEQIETLEIERYRPNVLIESFDDDHGRNKEATLEPWEEDSWTHLEVFDGRTAAAAGNEAVGGVPWGKDARGKGTGIDCVVRCARCMVPNTDPETGIRDSLMPYTLLQKFRQTPELKKSGSGKPAFGMLSSPCVNSGILRVGDIVRVTATTDPSIRDLDK